MKDELNKIFDYKNGCLYWKKPLSNRIKAGQKAGTSDGKGYEQTYFMGKLHKTHRLIFAMHYGYFPKIIDHVNGIKNDNRIENLRETTQQKNLFNSKIGKNNTSGIKGVSWNKRRKKWRADIYVNGKQKCFGYFDDLKQAEMTICEARIKFHKEFANNGTLSSNRRQGNM